MGKEYKEAVHRRNDNGWEALRTVMHLSGNQGTAHKSSRKTLFTPQISLRFWLNDVGHGPEFGELAPWRVVRVQPEPVLPGGQFRSAFTLPRVPAQQPRNFPI